MPDIENLLGLLDKGRDDAMLRFALGNAYFERKDYAQAIVHLRAAVDHDAKYSAAWKMLGKALMRQQQTADAELALQRGIEVAAEKGDKQAVREMQVFLKRLRSQMQGDVG